MSKVLLVLIDGMRPDCLEIADHPFFRQLLRESCYSMQMRTVMPSVTLPCHMSLFHSVAPERHGILTNTYVPQVRPVNGICEVLNNAGKSSSFFYAWEPLRDLSRPLSLQRSEFVSGKDYGFEEADRMITDRVLDMANSGNMTDFTFFYICWVDEAGHKYGWMSEEYMQAVRFAWDCLQRVAQVLPDDVKLIVTADHGGHDRSHGTGEPEDLQIPIFMRHKDIVPGKLEKDLRIIDIAPTITSWLGVPPDRDWEGSVIL